MIIKPELVKRIKEYFNLNIYETKVWLALLSKGIASAGEIAQLSSVPRSRTYDVLESLEKQGFALAKIGKPTKYIALKPTFILEKLKKKVMSEAEEKVDVLENLKGTNEYKELENLHGSSTSEIKREEISGAVKGRAEIFSHARGLIENAQKEVLICLPALELMEKSRIFNSAFENLKDKGISIRLVLKGSEEEIKKIESKLKIKTIKTNLNSKFFIIDKQQVLFFITQNTGDENELAVWLNSEFFSNALSQLFEQAHKK